jgi:hypothetical protein
LESSYLILLPLIPPCSVTEPIVESITWWRFCQRWLGWVSIWVSIWLWTLLCLQSFTPITTRIIAKRNPNNILDVFSMADLFLPYNEESVLITVISSCRMIIWWFTTVYIWRQRNEVRFIYRGTSTIKKKIPRSHQYIDK